MLAEFTSSGSDMDISDLLIAAGYPRITIPADKRHLAYECCLVYEVITKRVPALEDIRKGLASVKVRRKTVLDLLTKCPESERRFFPSHEREVIDLALLSSYVEYEADEPTSHNAQNYFEKYLAELDARGLVCTS